MDPGRKLSRWFFTYVKNDYPSGIITPTSIIPLVFYARDNYPEFFPTTLGEDVCWLGFQRKLSSRRSGILSIPRDCRHEGPTSAAMPRRSVPCRPESLAGQNCAALRRAAPGLWNATKPPCPRAAPCRAAAMCPPIAAPATRATIQNCPCGVLKFLTIRSRIALLVTRAADDR